MKKLFFTFLGFIFSIKTFASLRDDMIPNYDTVGVDGDGVGVLTQIIFYIKDFLFFILGFVAVGVFLYFGFKLIISKGNEEEFKKTLMGFVYAVIGLTIIPLAWSAVKIISTLNF